VGESRPYNPDPTPRRMIKSCEGEGGEDLSDEEHPKQDGGAEVVPVAETCEYELKRTANIASNAAFAKKLEINLPAAQPYKKLDKKQCQELVSACDNR
jgi:hypothetical protein